jgi:hypothetical protein
VLKIDKAAIARAVRGNAVTRNLAHLGELAAFVSELRERLGVCCRNIIAAVALGAG